MEEAEKHGARHLAPESSLLTVHVNKKNTSVLGRLLKNCNGFFFHHVMDQLIITVGGTTTDSMKAERAS